MAQVRQYKEVSSDFSARIWRPRSVLAVLNKGEYLLGLSGNFYNFHFFFFFVSFDTKSVIHNPDGRVKVRFLVGVAGVACYLAKKRYSHHKRLDLDCGFNVDTPAGCRNNLKKRTGMCWKKFWCDLQIGLLFSKRRKIDNIPTSDGWFEYSN